MGLFGPSTPKRVTPEEFAKIMSRIYGKLDEVERVEVEKLFRADLHETGMEFGITRSEFESAMTWVRENRSKHVLEENDIELLEEYFQEHLAD
jgi:BMFP domain-containing protein YqiC